MTYVIGDGRYGNSHSDSSENGRMENVYQLSVG